MRCWGSNRRLFAWKHVGGGGGGCAGGEEGMWAVGVGRGR